MADGEGEKKREEKEEASLLFRDILPYNVHLDATIEGLKKNACKSIFFG